MKLLKRQVEVRLAKVPKHDSEGTTLEDHVAIDATQIVGAVSDVAFQVFKLAVAYRCVDAGLFIIVNKALGRTGE